MKKIYLVFCGLIVASLLLLKLNDFFSIYDISIAKDKPSEEEITISSAPVDLSAKKDGLFGKDVYPKIQLVLAGKSGWITEFRSKVVNAPSQVLHHAVLGLATQNDTVCPQLKQPLYAAGRELTTVSFPEGYGYRIYSNTLFYFILHLRNDGNESYKDVRFEFKLKTEKPEENFSPIKPLMLSALPCSLEPSFAVDAGNQNFSVAMPEPFEAQEDGLIVTVGSHFHDKGKFLKILRNNEDIYTFEPKTDQQGKIIAIPSEKLTNPIPFSKGDTLDIKSLYRNDTDQVLEGMASAWLYYTPRKK